MAEWIPCSEQLPTREGYYQTTVLVTDPCNEHRRVANSYWNQLDARWSPEENEWGFAMIPLAWRECPKPWDGEVTRG